MLDNMENNNTQTVNIIQQTR